MFGSLAATLPGHLRVIRWDQRGCGRSEHRGPCRVVSVFDDDAARATGQLDELCARARRLHRTYMTGPGRSYMSRQLPRRAD